MEPRLDNLWKDFGRETEAGKLLFALYKVKNKPEVYYPPVKTKKKPLPFEETRSKPAEKPKVDYPAPKKPRTRKFHPIDFVPRRKHHDEIQLEINAQPRTGPVPPARGVNRDTLKQDLQEKFQFAEGRALPKAARAKPTANARAQPVPAKPQPQGEVPRDPNDLFDLVVQEIQERQQFLNDMREMGQLTAELEHRLKGEIAERFGDLQKLKDMH